VTVLDNFRVTGRVAVVTGAPASSFASGTSLVADAGFCAVKDLMARRCGIAPAGAAP
jgi:hypothetical protein